MCRPRTCCASCALRACSTSRTTSYVDSLMRPAYCSSVGAERLPAEDVGEVVGHDLLELVVAAALRVPVGAPPLELAGVAEPLALHVVVADLAHQVGRHWHER